MLRRAPSACAGSAVAAFYESLSLLDRSEETTRAATVLLLRAIKQPEDGALIEGYTVRMMIAHRVGDFRRGTSRRAGAAGWPSAAVGPSLNDMPSQGTPRGLWITLGVLLIAGAVFVGLTALALGLSGEFASVIPVEPETGFVTVIYVEVISLCVFAVGVAMTVAGLTTPKPSGQNGDSESVGDRAGP